MNKPRFSRLAAVLALLAVCRLAGAVVIEDNFTGPSSKYNWKSFNGACLTAGDNTGNIPACVGLSYYGSEQLVGGDSGLLPDPAGKGALRFTNGWPGGYGQNGAVVSNFTFPSNQGINVTFTTYTYLGDSGGAAGDGADGISFYLMDGSYVPGIGAWGGSLAYSCSNTNNPHDGLVGAYVGLGIDEYGNFLNKGDNTATGVAAVNGFGSGTYQPGRIGMRGAGSVAWAWLTKNYPSYYPSTLNSTQQQAAVQNSCKTGTLWNYSKPNKPTNTNATSASSGPKLMDYPVIPGANNTPDPAIFQIANESALTRGTGVATPTTATPITYNLTITQDGLLSLAYSYNGGTYQPVISKQSITASNGPLPANFRFGFAGSTGGSTNIHEVTCFKATPANVASSSAGLNVQQAGEVKTGTQVYLAYYHPDNWWGQLTSQDLVYNAASDTVTINPTANWDGSCVLTGGTCATTGASSGAAQVPTARTILSWNDVSKIGIPFQWTNLNSAQQTALNGVPSDSNGAKRVAYLRGDRTNEMTSTGSGLFRLRTGVLGDIVNSSPTFVGAPNAPYGKTWSDALYGSASNPENGTGAQTYASFVSAWATRTNVVYDGANDGILHGFRAGASDASGNYIATNNDGKELLGYVPNAVVQTIHSSTDPTLDFSSTKYAHNFFVDATPAVGDVFYGNAWHTWLVGGLGTGAMPGGPTSIGGNAVFALDVTDPSKFAESNASTLVKGEWGPATITCSLNPTCGTNFGQSVGTPVIRRLHNGMWAVIFGNGLNSTNGTAGIYVMTLDPSNGAQTVYYIDTGYGPTKDPLSKSRPNGIAYVTAADLDGDHIADYVYGGDVFGNVWRFDLTGNTPGQWKVSTYGTGAARPLFSTPGGQPITTQLIVAATPAGSGSPRVMVDFGTGQVTQQTTTAPAQYATGTQTLYGIWDYDMATWNGLSAVKYVNLSAPQSVTASGLQVQSVLGTYAATTTGAGKGYRTVSSNTVCWAGSTSCASGNTQFGWKMDLPSSSEQVVYSPILAYGAFIVNTTIPSANSILTCSVDSAKGWTMAISPSTGGAFSSSFFGDANNHFVTINNAVVSGIALSATGSPSVVTANKHPYLVNQTTSGVGTVNQINPPGGSQGGRLTWIQLR